MSITDPTHCNQHGARAPDACDDDTRRNVPGGANDGTIGRTRLRRGARLRTAHAGLRTVASLILAAGSIAFASPATAMCREAIASACDVPALTPDPAATPRVTSVRLDHDPERHGTVMQEGDPRPPVDAIQDALDEAPRPSPGAMVVTPLL